MKTRNLVLAVTTAGLLLGTGNLAAEVEQPWHLTAQFGGMRLDSDRQTRDDEERNEYDPSEGQDPQNRSEHEPSSR